MYVTTRPLNSPLNERTMLVGDYRITVSDDDDDITLLVRHPALKHSINIYNKERLYGDGRTLDLDAGTAITVRLSDNAPGHAILGIKAPDSCSIKLLKDS